MFSPKGSDQIISEKELQKSYEQKLRMAECAPSYVMKQRFKSQAAELALRLEVLQTQKSAAAVVVPNTPAPAPAPATPTQQQQTPSSPISTALLQPAPPSPLQQNVQNSRLQHKPSIIRPRSYRSTTSVELRVYGDLEKLAQAKTELANALGNPGTGNLENLSTLIRMISFELPLLEQNSDILGDFVEQLNANQTSAEATTGCVQLPLLVLVKITLDGKARYIPLLIRTLKRRQSDGLLPKPLKTGKPLPAGVVGYNDITVVGGRLASFLLGNDDISTDLDFAVEEVCRLANLSESWHSSEIGHLKWLSPFKLSPDSIHYTIKPFLTLVNKGIKWSPKAWSAKNWPLYVKGWSFNKADQPISLLPLLITKNRTTREKLAIGHSNLGTGGADKTVVLQQLEEQASSSDIVQQTSSSLVDSTIFSGNSLSASSQAISVEFGAMDQPMDSGFALDLSAFESLYTDIDSRTVYVDPDLPRQLPPSQEAALMLAFLDFDYPVSSTPQVC